MEDKDKKKVGELTPDTPLIERESTRVSNNFPIQELAPDQPGFKEDGKYQVETPVTDDNRIFFVAGSYPEVADEIQTALENKDDTVLDWHKNMGIIREEKKPEAVIDYKIGSIRGKNRESFKQLFINDNSLFYNVDTERVFDINDIPADLEYTDKINSLMSKESIKVPMGEYNPYLRLDDEMAKTKNKIDKYFDSRKDNIKYPESYSNNLAYYFQKTAEKLGLPENLLDLVISVVMNESSGIYNIRSATKARGLAQVTKDTFDEGRIQAEDEAFEIQKGIEAAARVILEKARQLKYLTGKTPTVENILRAYNAGQGPESKAMKGIPHEEQKRYGEPKIREINEYADKVKSIFEIIHGNIENLPSVEGMIDIGRRIKGKQYGGEIEGPLDQDFAALEQEFSALENPDLFAPTESEEYEPDYQNDFYYNDTIDFDYGDDTYEDPREALPAAMQTGLNYLAYEHEREKQGTAPELDKEKRKSANLLSIFYAKQNLAKGALSIVEGTLKGVGDIQANLKNWLSGQMEDKVKQFGEDRYRVRRPDGTYASKDYTRDELVALGYLDATKAKGTDQFAYKLGQQVADYKEGFYVPEEIQATTISQVTQGVGQAAPLMATGVVGGVTRTGQLLGATVGFFSNLGFQGDEIRKKQEKAKELTSDEFVKQGLGDKRTYDYLRENDAEDIVAKMIPGALASGTIETIGYSRVLKKVSKFNPAIADRMTSKLGKWFDDVLGKQKKLGILAGETIAEGFQGAFEEALQDAIMNVNARYVYDFTRSITNELDDSALVGGSTQAILTGLLGGLNLARGKVGKMMDGRTEVQRAIDEVQRASRLDNARAQAALAQINGENVPKDAAEILAKDKDEKAKRKNVEESIATFSQNETTVRKGKISSVANALSSALGVNVEVVDGNSDPSKRIIDPVSKKRASGVVNEDGTITIDAAVADENTAIHEFGHIFLDKIKQDSPEVYNKLLEEAKKKMPELTTQLSKDYGDKVENEVATRILEMYAAGKLDKRTRLYKLADQLWEYIKRLLGQGINKSIRGGQIDFTQLDPNTKLKDIGKLLGDIAYERRSVRGFYGGPNIAADRIGQGQQFLILDEYQYDFMGDQDAAQKLAEAKEMDKAGEKLTNIYSLTGWDKDVNGNWVADYPFHGTYDKLVQIQRQDNADLGGKLNTPMLDAINDLHNGIKETYESPSPENLQEYVGKMGGAVKGVEGNEIILNERLSFLFTDPAIKKLIDQGPLANTEIRLSYDPADTQTEASVQTFEGLFRGKGSNLRGEPNLAPVLKIYPNNISSDRLMPVLMHEIQHLLQGQRFSGSDVLASWSNNRDAIRESMIEKFETSFPEQLKEKYSGDPEAMVDQLMDDMDIYTAYVSFSHEVEARNAESRASDIGLRMEAISKTEDVPRQKQIRASQKIIDFYNNILAAYNSTTDPQAREYLQSVLDFGEKIGAYDPATGVTTNLDSINTQMINTLESYADAAVLQSILPKTGFKAERPIPKTSVPNTEAKQIHTRFIQALDKIRQKGIRLEGGYLESPNISAVVVGNNLAVSTRGLHDVANKNLIYDGSTDTFASLAQEEAKAMNDYMDFLELKAEDPALLPGAKVEILPFPNLVAIDVESMKREKQFQIIPDGFYETVEYKEAFAYFSSPQFVTNLKNSGLTLEQHILSVMKTLGISRSQAISAFEAATGKKYDIQTDPSQRMMYGSFREWNKNIKSKDQEGNFIQRRYFALKAKLGALSSYLWFKAGNMHLGIEEYVAAMSKDNANNLGVEEGKEGVALLKTEQSKTANYYKAITEKLFGNPRDKFKAGKPEKNSFIGRLIAAGLSWADLNDYAYAMHNEERNNRIILMRIDENYRRMERADELRKEASKATDPNEAARLNAKADKLDAEIDKVAKENDAVIAGKKSYTGMLQSQADAVIDLFRNKGKLDTAKKFMDEFREIVEQPMFELMEKHSLASPERIEALKKGSKMHPDGDTADFFYPEFEHYVPMVFDDTRLMQDEGLDPETGKFEKEISRTGLKGLKGTTRGEKVDRESPLEVMLSRSLSTAKRAHRNDALRSLADAIDLNNADYESRMEMLDQGLETFMADPASGLPLQRPDIDDAAIDQIQKNRRKPRVQIVPAKMEMETDSQGRSVFVDKTPDEVKANSVPFIMKDGNRGYMHFRDPNDMMLMGLKNAPLSDAAKVLNKISSFIRPLNNFLRAAYTWGNIKFVIGSAMRDRIDMQLQAAGYDFGADPKAVSKAMRRNYRKASKYLLSGDAIMKADPETKKYWKEAQEAGMPMSWASKTDHESLRQEIESAIRLSEGKLQPKNVFSFVDRLTKPVAELSDRVENMVRLTAYMTARQNGLSPARAAQIGKDITVNFEQKGQGQTLRAAMSLWLFMNPAIQGMNKNFKSLKNPRQIKKLLLNYTALAAVNAVLFHEISDDDDVKSHVLTDWIRGAYTMVPTLGIPIKIQKPYSTARLAMNLGENVVHAAYGYKTGSDITLDVLRDAMVLFDPVGGGSSSFLNYFPPFLSPAIQAVNNRNWLDDAIVKRSVAGIPNYLQPNPSTEEIYNKAAELIYSSTGGIDINPSQLEYAIEAYLQPGVIGDVMDVIKTVTDDTVDNKTERIIKSFVTGRIYDDLRDDQKAYLYPFWDIYEKTSARGLTERELDYYCEAGLVLQKINKLSQESFDEGITNIMRRYDWVDADAIRNAMQRGKVNSEKAIKKYGINIDKEGVKEREGQKMKREIRVDEPIIEKAGKEIDVNKITEIIED